jgi:hypothetical protein
MAHWLFCFVHFALLCVSAALGWLTADCPSGGFVVLPYYHAQATTRKVTRDSHAVPLMIDRLASCARTWATRRNESGTTYNFGRIKEGKSMQQVRHTSDNTTSTSEPLQRWTKIAVACSFIIQCTAAKAWAGQRT